MCALMNRSCCDLTRTKRYSHTGFKHPRTPKAQSCVSVRSGERPPKTISGCKFKRVLGILGHQTCTGVRPGDRALSSLHKPLENVSPNALLALSGRQTCVGVRPGDPDHQTLHTCWFLLYRGHRNQSRCACVRPARFQQSRLITTRPFGPVKSNETAVTYRFLCSE